MQDSVATYTVPKKMVNSYIDNQIMGLSPGQLLLTVYDVAIVACQQQDGDKAIRAISELISGLNFEHQEIALGLFRLYQYVNDQIRENNYNEALGILRELRDAWATALSDFN